MAPPVGPCGGFSRSYMSMCEANDIPARGDLIWYEAGNRALARRASAPVTPDDAAGSSCVAAGAGAYRDVDNVLATAGVHEFNLSEIEGVESGRQIVPILAALENNRVCEPHYLALWKRKDLCAHARGEGGPGPGLGPGGTCQWFTSLIVRNVHVAADCFDAIESLVRNEHARASALRCTPGLTGLCWRIGERHLRGGTVPAVDYVAAG